MISVDLAQFSKTPGARYPEEGPFSGKEFRTSFLLPRIEEAQREKSKITVILDGTSGIGTSFLEEAFGGLIREDNIDYRWLKENLKIQSKENPIYEEEVLEYMQDASKNKARK